jgi:HNH endonuclease
MTITNKDIKILWGRSGNRCAICKCCLTQDAASTSATFTLGQQAHIVGEKKTAARAESSLTPDERDSYHNLILLCPIHHTEIDKNETDWPIERLHLVKSTHELWVTETLSETIDHVKLAQHVSLSNIIDSAVKNCDLERWWMWTESALSPASQWYKDHPDTIWEFRQQVIATIWPPDYEELQRATETLSIMTLCAVQKFMEHSQFCDNRYIVDRFYRRQPHNPKAVEEFDDWQVKCDNLLIAATKAANWFADVVRRDINPMFFAANGKFLIGEEPQTFLPEFSEEEKAKLPRSPSEVIYTFPPTT